MNNAEAKRKSRDMREIIDELAFNPDTDFKLFLKFFTSIPNKHHNNEDQLSSYAGVQVDGQSSRIMNGV